MLTMAPSPGLLVGRFCHIAYTVRQVRGEYSASVRQVLDDRMAKKNNSGGLLSALGIAFVGYLALKRFGAAAYSRISFARPRIRFGRMLPYGIDVTVTLPVSNQNPAGITVDGLIGQIKYGPYTLFPFQLSNRVQIAANASTDVVFNGQIRFAEVGGNIAALITSGTLLQDLRVEGTAYVAGLSIPFSNTIGIG